ncbi:unnamed protein product [Lupinus luteus]|uniref:FAF domain-containing protein n=1 Tax=Lupinus luteus TaxID=3873 RepID=A0AAV1X5F1_LUPLU
MRIFSLYFPLIISFLSFIDSIINSIKKHVRSLIGFVTAINPTRNLIATDEHKLHLNSHRPISASATTHIDEFVMSSTESIDERQVNDHVDHEDHHDNNDNDDIKDDNYDCCYDLRRMRVAEGRQHCYPPPLSSWNRNCRPSFFLRPVRKNGRLILTKVRMKRHEKIYSSRENGRLRLYLVPDDDDDDDDEEEEDLVGEVAEQEEEMMVESDLEEEEEEIEEDRVGEWNYGMGGNEGFRSCHQVMNPCYHGSHQNLHMYGLGIA